MARPDTYEANMWQIIDVLDVTDALRGKNVCFTGHLGLPRKELISIINKAGGVFHPDIKGNTDFLITNRDWTTKTIQEGGGRVEKKSSKLIAAERQSSRTKVLSEQEFIDYISDHGKSCAG